MGTRGPLIYRSPRPKRPPTLPPDLRRRRPRSYIEWKTLRRWGRLPAWENDPPGYLLRLAREQASLTQEELAQVLGVSQQAVARAERAGSNPTVELIERWARQCGRELRWSLE
ncbi:MAG TPA: helix-turn-helix transcriptional regulator [Thermoanaerobaculia bacterium]|jgi:DNA-binding XRE family transcriptional regulator